MTLQLLEPLSSRNEHMETALQHKLGVAVRDLRVLMGPVSVLLVGRTETYHARQLAQQFAADLTPLKVINEITIQTC